MTSTTIVNTHVIRLTLNNICQKYSGFFFLHFYRNIWILWFLNIWLNAVIHCLVEAMQMSHYDRKYFVGTKACNAICKQQWLRVYIMNFRETISTVITNSNIHWTTCKKMSWICFAIHELRHITNIHMKNPSQFLWKKGSHLKFNANELIIDAIEQIFWLNRHKCEPIRVSIWRETKYLPEFSESMGSLVLSYINIDFVLQLLFEWAPNRW